MNNNPLKLSPRIDDAIRFLLKREHPSYLEPVDAVSESVEDLMHHQLAMKAGIQAALDEALDRFDPKHLVEKHGEKIAFRKKCKCWDDYLNSYEHLKDRAFEEFFGKAFVRAYEEQIERLRIKQPRK